MRLDEAIRIAQYARKPISVIPDFKTGRPTVQFWLVVNQRGYFGGDPDGFQICYSDMVPKMIANPRDIERHLYGGADDWEPYPGRYVIDFRRRYTMDPLRRGGWTPIKF
jgi:hypothetical protein